MTQTRIARRLLPEADLNPANFELFFAADDADRINKDTQRKECSAPGQFPPPCDVNLFLGLFFDGTNNNLKRDRPWHTQSNVARLLSFCLALLALALTGCATTDDRLSLSVRALNYTDKEVEYIAIEAPDDRDNGGGGEAMNPYGGGGNGCCFSVPREWHPGLKALVRFKFTHEEGEAHLPPFPPRYSPYTIKVNTRVVDIPPYDPTTAADVWTIVHADESIEVVVTFVEPNHPAWPGRVKGRPVPSREYRLKLWQEEVNRVRTSLESQKKRNHHDSESRKKSWEIFQQYDKDDIRDFLGPNDQRFLELLLKRQMELIDYDQRKLDYLLANKP